MPWSTAQLAELARQYERIGYVVREQWPAPPDSAGPAAILAMLRRIPDGAGRAGYCAELAKLVQP